MSKYLVGMACGILVVSTIAMSTETKMSNHWVCTTNASREAIEKDNMKMKLQAKSAGESFSYASHHCGDCTKITCEIQ